MEFTCFVCTTEGRSVRAETCIPTGAVCRQHAIEFYTLIVQEGAKGSRSSVVVDVPPKEPEARVKRSFNFAMKQDPVAKPLSLHRN